MLINILKPNFSFEDTRGSLKQLVREGYSQFNVIRSASGSLRGGHYHNYNSEAFYIIYGMFELEVWEEGGEAKEVYLFTTGDMFEIPPHIVHSFYFKAETLLVSMYSKGVELENGSKDIIACEAGNIPSETVRLPEKILEIDSDNDCPNCISEIYAGSKKKLHPVKKLNIKLENESRFKITYRADFKDAAYAKCFILNGKKIRLKIEGIICTNEKESCAVDNKLIKYNDADLIDDGFYNIKSLNPSFEFELPVASVKEVTVTGQWFVECGLSEIKSAYDYILGTNEGYSYSQRDEYIKELKKQLHKKDNEIKTVKKHQEKIQIYNEVLEKDLKEKDDIIKELEHKIKVISDTKTDTGLTNRLFRPWEHELKLIEAENRILVKENEQMKADIAECRQEIDRIGSNIMECRQENDRIEADLREANLSQLNRIFNEFKDNTGSLFHEKHEMILEDRKHINDIKARIESDVKWIETIREEIYKEIYDESLKRQKFEEEIKELLDEMKGNV